MNVASWAKGRSRSRALNGVLQRACPELLLGRIQLGFVHVRTKHNPADDPTRGRPVRARPISTPLPGSALARLLGVGPPLSFVEAGELFGCEAGLPPALFGKGEGVVPYCEGP